MKGNLERKGSWKETLRKPGSGSHFSTTSHSIEWLALLCMLTFTLPPAWRNLPSSIDIRRRRWNEQPKAQIWHGWQHVQPKKKKRETERQRERNIKWSYIIAEKKIYSIASNSLFNSHTFILYLKIFFSSFVPVIQIIQTCIANKYFLPYQWFYVDMYHTSVQMPEKEDRQTIKLNWEQNNPCSLNTFTGYES